MELSDECSIWEQAASRKRDGWRKMERTCSIVEREQRYLDALTSRRWIARESAGLARKGSAQVADTMYTQS